MGAPASAKSAGPAPGIAYSKGSSAVSKAHKELARLFFLENAAMNAVKRSAEALRKDLFTDLADAGIEQFNFATTDGDGKKIQLEVTVATPEVEFVDVAVLKGLVTDEQFMAIVSATKKAVEEHAGKAIAVRSVAVRDGVRNVFVKAAA